MDEPERVKKTRGTNLAGLTRYRLLQLKRKVELQGLRAIDLRTSGAKAFVAFERELIAHLGGDKDMTPQRRCIVGLIARTSLLIDHADSYLINQHSIINKNKKAFLPIVLERQKLADSLAKMLALIGLDRLPIKVPDLQTYLAETYTDQAPEPEPTPEQAA